MNAYKTKNGIDRMRRKITMESHGKEEESKWARQTQ